MTRILIVDDETTIAEMLGDVLAEEGYEVRLATHGRAALAEMALWRPDLVISDLMMPVMGGAELAQTIRTTPDYQDLPIVMISAGAVQGLPPPELYQAFLSKPFHLDEMINLVNQLLGDGG
jgi:CheY-like chemotaxis protein